MIALLHLWIIERLALCDIYLLYSRNVLKAIMMQTIATCYSIFFYIFLFVLQLKPYRTKALSCQGHSWR